MNASERAVDQCVEWGLRTNLTGEVPPDLRVRIEAAAHAPVAAVTTPRPPAWAWSRRLLAVAGIVVAVGVAWLVRSERAAPRVSLQEPAPVPAPAPPPGLVPSVHQAPAPAGGPAARDAWLVTGAADGDGELPPDVTALKLLRWSGPGGIGAVLARVPKLERLDLGVVADCPELTEADLQAIGRHLPLRELRLVGRRELAADWLAHLAGLPALRVLALSHAALGDAGAERVARLPVLEVVELRFDHALGNAGVAALATLPGLRELSLDGCSGVDAAGLAALGALRQLERLDLDLCNGAHLPVDRRLPAHFVVRAEAMLGAEMMMQGGRTGGVDDGVLAALAACTRLRELRVLGCRAVTRDGLARLAKLPLRRLAVSLPEQDTIAFVDALPPTLETLSLAWSRRCDDAVLKAVAARLPLLHDLDLMQCTAVTDDGLRALAQLPLRRLGLRGCGGLSSDALQPLLALRRLEELDLSGARWVDAAAEAALKTLPAMKNLFVRRGGTLIEVPAPERRDAGR